MGRALRVGLIDRSPRWGLDEGLGQATRGSAKPPPLAINDGPVGAKNVHVNRGYQCKLLQFPKYRNSALISA